METILLRGTAPGIEGSYLTEFNIRPEQPQGPAAEAGRRIAGQIPTCFGRLVFIHSLRNSQTGRYFHPLLAEKFGGDTADRTLSHRHYQVFMEWLRLNLSDQKDDLGEYLRAMGGNTSHIPYRELIPATAHEVEKQLYLSDLEVVLQLISFE